MLRPRIAALAAGGDSDGVDPRAELHRGDEAVAVVAIAVLDPRQCRSADGGERAPVRGGEGDRQAWCGVGKLRLDGVGEALEPVRLAPWRAPSAEIGGQTRAGVCQRFQPLRRRRMGEHGIVGGETAVMRRLAGRPPQRLAPIDCERGGDRVRRPAPVPGAQHRDLRRNRGLDRVGRSSRVIGRKQLGDEDVEARLAGVEGCRHQGGQGEISLALQ